VDSNIQTASLLPYLCDNGGKICLDISTMKTGPDQSGGQVGTFIPDYIGDFLTVGFNAHIRTDFGSLVKQVMLLTQRDQYPLLNRHFPKVTNTTVDKCWLQVAGPHDVDGVVPDQILFADQFADGGRLLPFASLFFCNKRELFFHPPCLRCGKMLSLCHDDELLAEFGLPHYSKSLRRYMYCPSCTPLHGGPWYARTMDGEEKSVVKDSAQLINDFGSIQGSIDPDSRFPCTECQHREDCYGPAAGVFDVIALFSFYPFYMILRQNISFSGHDYLAMVSGASTGQLADYWLERGVFPSSMNSEEQPENSGIEGFLYPVEDSRHFLEVLYLKMQFIKLVATDLVNNSLSDRFSDHYMSTNTIGVSLIANSSFPSFWSFSLSYPGLGESFSEVTQYPKETGQNHTYTIGLLWFVVLLANRQQGETEIFEQLNSLLESSDDKMVVLREHDEMFQPCQLFWSARDEYANSSRWTEQWDKILATGSKFLGAGYHNDNSEKTTILETIDDCLAELKGYILSPAQAETKHIHNSDDLEIFNIIEKVKEKWEQNEKQSPVDMASPRTGFEEFVYPESDQSEQPKTVQESDSDKTLIIPPGSKTTPMTPAAITGVSGVDDGNAFEETVIISPNEKYSQQAGSDPIEKTSDPLQNIAPSSGDEELEETIQIRANAESIPIDTEGRQKSIGDIVKDNSRKYDDEDDFLTETVVLRPIKKDG